MSRLADLVEYIFLGGEDPKRLRTGAYFVWACIPIFIYGALIERDQPTVVLTMLGLTIVVGLYGYAAWRKAKRLSA